MSALGQKRASAHVNGMSALPPKADIAARDWHVRDDRTIDSHVKRLRRKFKASDNEFDMIETLYGLGYRFKELAVLFEQVQADERCSAIHLSNHPSKVWRSPWRRVRCAATEKRRSRSRTRTRRKAPKRPHRSPACTARSNSAPRTRSNTARSTSRRSPRLLPQARAPYHDDRANMRRPTAGSGQKQAHDKVASTCALTDCQNVLLFLAAFLTHVRHPNLSLSCRDAI